MYNLVRGKREKKISFIKLEKIIIIFIVIGYLFSLITLSIINSPKMIHYDTFCGPELPKQAKIVEMSVVMPEMTLDEMQKIINNYVSVYEPYNISPREPFPLSNSDRHYIECIVAGESGNESYDGKIAVAQCIRNGLEKGGEGYTPQQLRKDSQYDGFNNHPEDYPEVKKAVKAVFDNGVMITEENILWFYAPKWCKSSWHESQKFVFEIGGHRFFAPWN